MQSGLQSLADYVLIAVAHLSTHPPSPTNTNCLEAAGVWMHPAFCAAFPTGIYAGQRWGLRCRWESLQIGNIERAFKIVIYSKLSLGFLPLWRRFWESWANHLKSPLQLNHVPVHQTHSAMVIKIRTTSKTPSLNRIDSTSIP